MQLLWSLLAVLYPFVSAHHDLEQVAAQLKSHLSSEAIVTFPWDPRWQDLQTRASYPRLSPDYNVVVEVATESDVQATIRLANQFSIPFLAVSGGHGWSNSLKKFPYGIQIKMRRMNTMTLSADGRTAYVGGGMLQHELVRSLFATGKYAGKNFHLCPKISYASNGYPGQSPASANVHRLQAHSLAAATVFSKDSMALHLMVSYPHALLSPAAKS
jgi:hypothetical protein